MVSVIPSRLKSFWDEWNLRVAVLVSLMLQIFLIFAATSRKRKRPGILSILVWVAYLLADWVAAFAVGLIASGVGNDCPDEFKISTHIAGFWAPFLLLHLGGPDSITAFSLEDNELWIRHLFGLLIQLVAVIYVYLVSLNDDFFLPTLLVLLAGAFKYAERTRSLYVACLGNFKDSLLPKPDAGPNYAQLMEEFRSREEANVPVKIIIEPEVHKSEIYPEPDETKSIIDIAVVQNAFRFYNAFRGLIVDHMLSFQERYDSRKFFFNMNSKDAFRVMEAELNFMYDALYTKTSVVHHWVWYTLRSICSVLLLVSMILFMSHHKQKIHHVDIAISYTLLIGALVLDLVGHLKLIFSDWTIASFSELEEDGHEYPWYVRFISAGRRYLSFKLTSRWCETIPRHSLIYYCVRPRSKWIDTVLQFIGAKPVLDEWKYKMLHYGDDYQSRWYENLFDFIGAKFLLDEEKYKMSKRYKYEKLKIVIYKQLRMKAIKASDIKASREISSARGELALLDHPCHYPHGLIKRSVSEDVEFDESVLLWHIATELCYYHESNYRGNPDLNTELCMLLSEYLVYLLVMKPTMMSRVAGIAQIRFQDTCAEAKRFLDDNPPKGYFSSWFKCRNQPRIPRLSKFLKFYRSTHTEVEKKRKTASEDLSSVKTVTKPAEVKGDRSKFWKFYRSTHMEFEKKRENACKDLSSVKTVTKPAEVKGDRSKSVLFDACMLAQELLGINERKRWDMMSEVWMELLCYGAIHCRANSHAQQLSKGGELISFVWLLMAHFGLGEQFRIAAGHARAKLIVDK